MGTYFHFKDDANVDTDSFRWVPVTGLVVYIFTYTLGTKAVPKLLSLRLDFWNNIYRQKLKAGIKYNSFPIRLLRLTSQNYVISHWVAYYDVKYNELNEAFTVFSNLFET